jgi:hypothetical protein
MAAKELNPVHIPLPSPTATRKNLGRIPYHLSSASNENNENKKNTARKNVVLSDELTGEEESAHNTSTMSLSSYVDLSNYKTLSHPSHRLGESPKIISEMHYTNTKGSKPANDIIPSPEKLLPTIAEKKQILPKQTPAKNTKVALPHALKVRPDKTLQQSAPRAPSLIIKVHFDRT